MSERGGSSAGRGGTRDFHNPGRCLPVLLWRAIIQPRWPHSNQRYNPPIKQRREGDSMPKFADQKGKIGYIILWLMGVPASILILIFLLRGCT